MKSYVIYCCPYLSVHFTGSDTLIVISVDLLIINADKIKMQLKLAENCGGNEAGSTTNNTKDSENWFPQNRNFTPRKFLD